MIEKAGNNGSGSIDAACRIYLSKDKMAAWSFVFPPMGEGKLRGEAIGKALEESGVTTGIDPASWCVFSRNRSILNWCRLPLVRPLWRA